MQNKLFSSALLQDLHAAVDLAKSFQDLGAASYWLNHTSRKSTQLQYLPNLLRI
jgi:hypothetical protein